MPRITITNRQRAPIYEQLRRHIASIDDVRAFADADPEEAGRLALQYTDDFRLLEDLGWDREDPRDSIRLTMPPIDLCQALMRVQAEAEKRVGHRAQGRIGETWKSSSPPVRLATSSSTSSMPSSKARRHGRGTPGSSWSAEFIYENLGLST